MAWMRERIELPPELNARDREIVLDEVTDFIRKRSARGRDKNNRAFPEYSKEYKNSLDFRNTGKTPGNVNLKLSGDMLAALDTISHRQGSGLIGYENGTEENDRAEGNITGSYGGKANPAKARDFLGITDKDLEKVVNKKSVVDRLSVDVSELPNGRLGIRARVS